MSLLSLNLFLPNLPSSSDHAHICPSTRMSTHPLAHQQTHTPIHMSIHPSVHTVTHPSIHLSITVYPSVYSPIFTLPLSISPPSHLATYSHIHPTDICSDKIPKLWAAQDMVPPPELCQVS